MSNNIIQIDSTDCAARHNASTVRAKALEIAEKHGRVIFDLSAVCSMSHGYADELFAVLVASKGWDWFDARIKVRNGSYDVRRSISEAILYRCPEIRGLLPQDEGDSTADAAPCASPA